MLLGSPILIGLIVAVCSGVAFVAARRYCTFRPVRSAGYMFAAVGTAAGIVVASWGLWLAAGDTSPTTKEIAEGVTYERLRTDNNAVAHLVTIDLNTECIKLITTDVTDEGKVDALRTETWAQRESALVAMNASFFFPHLDELPWSSYPEEGEEVSILGKAVIEGETKGMPRDWQGNWDGHTVHIDQAGTPKITYDFASTAVWGVTGRERILKKNQVTAGPSEPYPRSVIGVNTETKMMWWLAVDGKQPGYSNGVTLRSAAELLKSLGAADAVEFDGGGSTILVEGADVLSRPLNRRIPNRSRPIANHVGLIDNCV